MSKADMREVERKIANRAIKVREEDGCVIVTQLRRLKEGGKATIRSAYHGKMVVFETALVSGMTIVPHNPEWETKTLPAEAEERRDGHGEIEDT